MYKTTGILLASMMVGSAALASHGTASIVLDNRFDGKADVFIDGYFSGEIRGDTRETYSIRPGNRDVLVLREGGAVLLNKTLRVQGGDLTVVRVDPPQGTLSVRNSGRAPLMVAADNRSVWVTPGSTTQLVVTTGNVALTSMTQDRFGKTTVVNRQTVWVEPGKKGSAIVKYEPPIRTGITIQNKDHHSLRVVIGNRDFGFVQPGGEMFADVLPGRMWVEVTRLGGEPMFKGNVTVLRGAASKVVVDEDRSGKVYAGNGSKWKAYEYGGWNVDDGHSGRDRDDDRHRDRDRDRGHTRYRW